MKEVIYYRGAIVAAKAISLALLILILRLDNNSVVLSSSVLLVLTFLESLKRLVYYGMPGLFIHNSKLSKSSSYLHLMRRSGFGRYSVIHLSTAFFLPVFLLSASGSISNTPLNLIMVGLAVLVLADVSFACHILSLKAKFAGEPRISMILSDLWILVSFLIAAVCWKIGESSYLFREHSVCSVVLIAAVAASVGLHCLLFSDCLLLSKSCESWLCIESPHEQKMRKRSILAGIANFIVTEILKWAPYLTAFMLLRQETSLSINLATRIAALMLIPLMAANIKNAHLYSTYVHQGKYVSLSHLVSSEVRYMRKLLAPTVLLAILAYAGVISFIPVRTTAKEFIIVFLIFMSAISNAYSGPTNIILELRLETFKQATFGLVVIGVIFIATSAATFFALGVSSAHGAVAYGSSFSYIIAGLSLVFTIVYQINQWSLLNRFLRTAIQN